MMCCRTEGRLKYAPLYIHSFRLGAPRKLLEAQQFARQYLRYEAIPNVPDRLRWLRHSKGLMQKEVASIAGVTRGTYVDIESGVTRYVPREMADKLAAFYRIPVTDLLDAYSRFYYDGQGKSIVAHRERLGMSQIEFAHHIGVYPRLVRAWENETRILSMKCWKRYFT